MIETTSINECLETFKSQLVEIVDDTKHTVGHVDDLIGGLREVEDNLNDLHGTFLKENGLVLLVVGEDQLSRYQSNCRIGESSINVQWIDADKSTVTPQRYPLYLIARNIGKCG